MADRAEIVVVFNNVPGARGLAEGFGLAVWVQVGGHAVLLDTGSDGDVLLGNLSALGLNPASLEAVVLSHDHWDHRDGLPALLERAPEALPVYVPARAQEALRARFPAARLVAVDEPVAVAPGVWTSGQVVGVYKDAPLPEHALVVETSEGLLLAAGCSHPGIDRLLERVVSHWPDRPVRLAAGGFHLRDHDAAAIRSLSGRLRPLVRQVAPSHCSGELAREIFRDLWGTDFLDLGLGGRFSLPTDPAGGQP